MAQERAYGRIDPFLASAGRRLRERSNAMREVLEHHGEIGRGHEAAFADELRALLPQRIAVKTGFVLGAYGEISRQLDLVLMDALTYPTFSYDAGEMILPDAVLGVISVKTQLRPTDLTTYFAEAVEFKMLMRRALGAAQWPGFYAVIGYWLDGAPTALVDRFHAAVFRRAEKRMGVDLVSAIDRGPICVDLSTLGDPLAEVPAFVAHRSHVPGIAFDACNIETGEPFIDMYKLIIRAIDPARLSRVVELAAAPPGVNIPEGVSRDPSFGATFAGKSADLLLAPGMRGFFTIFYANTGSAGWDRGQATDAHLVVAGPQGYTAPVGLWRKHWLTENSYCVQTQTKVAPGQIGTFTFEVLVPPDVRPGVYRFYGRPAVAGVGALTPETRAHAVSVVPPEQLGALEEGALRQSPSAANLIR